MIIKWTPEVFPDTAFSGGTGSHQPSIVKTKPILKNPTLTALKAREDKDVSLCLIINFSNMTLSSPPLKTPCHSSRTTPATTPGLSLTSSGGNIPKLKKTGKLSLQLLFWLFWELVRNKKNRHQDLIVKNVSVLIFTGIVIYCNPSWNFIEGYAFFIAGFICLAPGGYHLVYLYLAVKGKRGFDFHHLPMFN